MSSLPVKLYTAAQVRELDKLCIEEFDVPGATLMERAGQAAYQLLTKAWPDAWRIVVVCGTGNNGGDGAVIARLAQRNDSNVTLLYVGDMSKIQGDALTMLQQAKEAGVTVEPFHSEKLKLADVIVDAIFGTGLDRRVSGDAGSAIDAINASPSPVLAVDIPSGLHSDTGVRLGATVEADHTISFIGLKQGLLTGEGPGFVGAVHFAELDVPDEVYKAVPNSSRRIDQAFVRKHLPARRKTGHKGTYGHTLILGGNNGFAGAGRMASEAAARSGSGLVSLATRRAHASFICVDRPEIMVHGVEEPSDLNAVLPRVNVIAVGPGLGQTKWSNFMLQTAIDAGRPLVLDADALNLLALDPIKRDNWVLTPHPGEAARMLNTSIQEVQNDRFAAVCEIQHKYGGVCVLKGAGTLVVSNLGKVAVCNQGNPGMASGGMGDVLTGVIAGLIAQGLGVVTAARAGVVVHANAGDLAAKEGQRGMLATDLLPGIRKLVNL